VKKEQNRNGAQRNGGLLFSLYCKRYEDVILVNNRVHGDMLRISVYSVVKNTTKTTNLSPITV